MTDAPKPDTDAPLVAPNFITEVIEKDLESGKYPKVVTRFPPDPSGYAHLGHVFASLLDFNTAQQYGGQFNLRMDDTNPELARQEYVDSMADDLKWLGLDWGEHFYYASDYFDRYYEYAEQLIRQGDAYVDSVSAEEMSRLRGNATTPGTPSPYRGRSVEENLDLLRRMKAGEFSDGEHVLRAKIDLSAPNIKLRDPVLYRIVNKPHFRTGDTWKIYPAYDFEHPLQDAIEGVTHSMCSLEFIDNRAIYDWLMEKLGFDPRPHQYEFGRRGLEYTITSKRKLRQLVQEGKVSGWDDPRMPTLRAQRRLGVTPEAMRAFASQIGVNRTNRTVDLAVYENAVRDDLNWRAPRVMAVLEPLRVTLTNLDAPQTLSLPYWPYDVVRDSPDGLVSLPTGERVDPEKAVRDVPLTRELYIERSDFEVDPPKGFKRLTPGGTVRLRGAGIIRADEVETDESGQVTHIKASLVGEETGAKGVIHWVSAEHALPAEFRLYDRLFRVPNPEGDNEDVDDDSAGPSEHEAEHEEAPVSAGFMRYLTPDSLQVRQGFVEPSVANDPQDTRYQFERQGYFWRDPVDSRADALVFGRIITLKDTWAKEAQKAEGGKQKAERQNVETSKRGNEKAADTPAKAQPLTPEQDAEFSRLTALGAAEGDARTVAKDPALLAFLAGAVQDTTFGQVASWTVNELVAGLRSGTVKVKAADLAPLAAQYAEGRLPARVARDALARAAATGDAPLDIIEREGLNAGLSAEELQKAVAEVLSANPDKVEAYRGGKTALLGFFTGQVMRATGGKADPQQLAEALKAALA